MVHETRMSRDESPDDEAGTDTHALYLAPVEIQMPKDGVIPVVRPGTMGGTPNHTESEKSE